ncbi:MAG: ATP-binding cassette domain-containing protein [Luminiphilus sp.]|nr:ATP-binding cassette domain-containing protein [Luminiphilus sp.]MDG2138207.1 ATP-binding cassette domain-containing protein [Luminiphilus sp.]MDG2492900.1 ATP-binding cassette domain-containing protein [Luminiphilus sp.]
MGDLVLSCFGLEKSYQDGANSVKVLQGVELALEQGERIAIVGRSGSGKSTLLNLLGGLDIPTAGEVLVSNKSLSRMGERARSQWRNRQLGFVFQFHHLLPEFTALEAVAMPMRIGGEAKGAAQERAAMLLDRVGLSERVSHKPAALSGGERQRVAIARALANKPGCVLMDEPTGNLDPESAELVLNLIESIDWGDTAFIIVTHDPKIAEKMDRQLVLESGCLSDLPRALV